MALELLRRSRRGGLAPLLLFLLLLFVAAATAQQTTAVEGELSTAVGAPTTEMVVIVTSTPPARSTLITSTRTPTSLIPTNVSTGTDSASLIPTNKAEGPAEPNREIPKVVIIVASLGGTGVLAAVLMGLYYCCCKNSRKKKKEARKKPLSDEFFEPIRAGPEGSSAVRVPVLPMPLPQRQQQQQQDGVGFVGANSREQLPGYPAMEHRESNGGHWPLAGDARGPSPNSLPPPRWHEHDGWPLADGHGGGPTPLSAPPSAPRSGMVSKSYYKGPLALQPQQQQWDPQQAGMWDQQSMQQVVRNPHHSVQNYGNGRGMLDPQNGVYPAAGAGAGGRSPVGGWQQEPRAPRMSRVEMP